MKHIATVLHGLPESISAKLRDAHVDGQLRRRTGSHMLRSLQSIGSGGRIIYRWNLRVEPLIPSMRPSRIAVTPEREASFPLSFRIPGWCKNAGLRVNGSAITTASDANGFVRVERLWKPNDKIRLELPMSPRITTGRDANAGGPPYASVTFGPLLFALPIAEGKMRTRRPRRPSGNMHSMLRATSREPV